MRAFAPAVAGLRPGRCAVLAAGVAVGVVVGCEGGLFAPRAAIPAVARLAIAGFTAPLGGSAAAFDRVDAVHLRLMRDGLAALDTVVAFHSAGDETRVTVALPPDVLLDTARYEVELTSGGIPLFSSSGPVVLRRGETTPVTIALTPVVSGLQLSPPTPAFTAIGDTAWAHGAVVFSTGDTLRTAQPAWTSLDPAIVSAGSDGLLVARAEGNARIQASWGSLAQVSTITVSAVVSSVTLTPRNATLGLNDPPLRFTAVARDRRGNVLSRAFSWASTNAAAARVDAGGLVTPVAPGATFIVAAVGAIRDTTLLTVTGLPSAAPSALTATALSATQIRLAWSDNSNDETGFRIERCAGAGCTGFAEIAVVAANTTTYADTGLTRSTAYSYRVRSYSPGGYSSYSSVATASTTAGQAPVLSGGTVTLVQVVDPACYYAPLDLTGSSHRISFTYSDVDGDVDLVLSAIGGTAVGYPTGSTNTLTTSGLRNPSLTGTGSAGQIQFTLCFIFRTDQYIDVTVTLTDAGALTGTLSPIRILKPSGGS